MEQKGLFSRSEEKKKGVYISPVRTHASFDPDPTLEKN